MEGLAAHTGTSARTVAHTHPGHAGDGPLRRLIAP